MPFVADQMYPLLRKIVDDVITVPEEKVKAAIKLLALENKLVVEGAGAHSIAAALETPAERRGKSVCIVTGGNIGQDVLFEIISRAL